jgi:preprotein translocase subunit YajC
MFFDLVANAYAMGPKPQGEGGTQDMIMSFAPLILIFVVFYFLMVRPQQKKAKQLREMIDSLKKGDKVVTNAGIYGVIESVEETTVHIKIAENVKIKVSRAAISQIRTTDD